MRFKLGDYGRRGFGHSFCVGAGGMDIAPFVQLVSQLLADDNVARRQAEAGLDEAKANVPDQLVVALALILQTESVNIQVRLLRGSLRQRICFTAFIAC